MAKAEFSASLLQSSVSHDPSEIILICWYPQETFHIIINVKNSCAASYFCVTHDFFQDLLINRKFKRIEFILNVK